VFIGRKSKAEVAAAPSPEKPAVRLLPATVVIMGAWAKMFWLLKNKMAANARVHGNIDFIIIILLILIFYKDILILFISKIN